MAREPSIPIFLWIATAILAHLLWAGGADRVSDRLQETLDVRRFAQSVQRHVRSSLPPIEVALLDDDTAPEDEPPRDPPEADSAGDPEPSPEEAAPDPNDPEAAKKDEARAERRPEPEHEPPPEEREKKKEEAKAEEKKKAEEERKAPANVIPELEIRKRIAVRQHVEKKDQENPDAEFIADEANKVAEQTQARITSTTQNDPKPTPGGNHAGSASNPGDSEEQEVAQHEDRPGEQDRAPQDEASGTPKPENAPPPSSGDPDSRIAAREAVREVKPSEGCVGCDDRAPPRSARAPAQPGAAERAAVEGSDAMPEVASAEEGEAIRREAAEQDARRASKARRKRLPAPKRRSGGLEMLGFGAGSATQSGVNLNLSPAAAVAAIGVDQLEKERVADGERRRSRHRGSWKSLGLERWRSAIENYVSSVKPGNQTALNTARVPFATYLNEIHNRLHPVFADSFLGSLSSLPGDHPMNQPDIKTNLEIVLTGDSGRIVKMGVTKTSGVTAFDIAALEAVQRAQPFGAPPSAILSPDGNVYLHWEFHRNPYYACSTYFARPFILKVKPETAPPRIDPPTAPPFQPGESPIPPAERHGRLQADEPGAPRDPT